MDRLKYGLAVLALAAQIGLVAGPWRASLPQGLAAMSGVAPVERSADIAFGSPFAGYVKFLRQRVPEEGIVGLPPADEQPVLGHTGLMQYMLFPRRTTNCPPDQPISACAAQLSGPDIYVLRVGDYPTQALLEELGKVYVGFSDDRGLYVPSGSGP